MTIALFFFAAALLGWTYVGYPAAMALYARRRPLPPLRRDLSWEPLVTVIIPARDEERVLGAKIDSVLAQRWPLAMLEVIVVDDGSKDGTARVVGSYAERGVRLLSMGRSQGKAAALNQAVARARGEVLVLTDARQCLHADAVRELVATLGDPSVGAVSGELELEASGTGGFSLYRKIDDGMRRWEAATGSSVGVTGALWAMHRSLWTALPAGTLLDDLQQPLCIVGQGARVVVEPRARCIDAAAPGGPNELQRRVRTLAGNLQLVRAMPELLSPRHPMFFRLLSHKLLRLVAPGALVLLAVTNLILWRRPFFNLVLAGQIMMYGLAAVQVPARTQGMLAKLARVCRTFVMLHVAAALAVWSFLRSKESKLWRRSMTPALGVPSVPSMAGAARAVSGPSPVTSPRGVARTPARVFATPARDGALASPRDGAPALAPRRATVLGFAAATTATTADDAATREAAGGEPLPAEPVTVATDAPAKGDVTGQGARA